MVEVRRQQVELKAARAELNRVEQLADKGLMSTADVERARTKVETQQLNYQESVLAMANARPRLTVVKALKTQDAQGRKFVHLILANRTPGLSAEDVALLGQTRESDPLAAKVANRDVDDIFASLRDTGAVSTPNAPAAGRGVTIALPYEHEIHRLAYGQSIELVFQLLKDVDSVTLVLSHHGEERQIDIQLQQDGGAGMINITSTQVSQEADLGGQASFDLLLSRSNVEVQSFQLLAAGLPAQVTYSFVDPTTQARLSRVSFPAGVTQRPLELKVFLPERADSAVGIDRPIKFWAVASMTDVGTVFAEPRAYSAAELQASRAGFTQLEMIPRGVGRIEVSAPSLYSEIRPDDRVETNLTIKNTGTRRLDNVSVQVDTPSGWRAQSSPSVLASLDPAAERLVRVIIAPPPRVTVGDYEVRINTESFAFNRRVPSENKIYRVSIKPGSNVWATGTLVALFLGIIAAVVIFGVKLTRR